MHYITFRVLFLHHQILLVCILAIIHNGPGYPFLIDLFGRWKLLYFFWGTMRERKKSLTKRNLVQRNWHFNQKCCFWLQQNNWAKYPLSCAWKNCFTYSYYSVGAPNKVYVSYARKKKKWENFMQVIFRELNNGYGFACSYIVRKYEISSVQVQHL